MRSVAIIGIARDGETLFPLHAERLVVVVPSRSMMSGTVEAGVITIARSGGWGN